MAAQHEGTAGAISSGLYTAHCNGESVVRFTLHESVVVYPNYSINNLSLVIYEFYDIFV